jgi:hypothetical protein
MMQEKLMLDNMKKSGSIIAIFSSNELQTFTGWFSPLRVPNHCSSFIRIYSCVVLEFWLKNLCINIE